MNIGIINDIHLDTKYPHKYNIQDPYYQYGSYKEDSPETLFNFVIQQMNNQSKQQKIDVMLVNGDFNRHGLSLYSKDSQNETKKQEIWNEMKNNFNKVMNNLKNEFKNDQYNKNIQFLPCIGNNDVIFHNSAPYNDEDSKNYYTDLYDIWFKSMDNELNPASKQTFLTGGYYQYEDPSDSKINFLALNSIYFNIDNKNQLEKADQQMQWLEQILRTNKNSQQKKKFIITMHIFPGLNYYKGIQKFWHKNYTNIYFNLMTQFSDDIIITTAAHIHRSDIRAPILDNLNIAFLITPSISPFYKNNPSYSLMKISSEKILDFKYYSFQLNLHKLLGTMEWLETDPQAEIGFDLNQPATIKNSTKQIRNDQNIDQYSKQLELKYGYTDYCTQLFLYFVMPNSDYDQNKKGDICCQSYTEENDEFYECME